MLLKTFFNQSTKAQLTAFDTYGIARQYEIFLCGMQSVHPPAMHLATPFALHGRAVVDLLKAKLSQAEDDLTIRDIVFLLTEMKNRQTYNVADDVELMNLIDAGITRMKDENWKQSVEAMVDEIKEGARP